MTGAYFVNKSTIVWPDGTLTDRYGRLVKSKEFEVREYSNGCRTLLYKNTGIEVILRAADGITFQRVGTLFPISKAT